MKFWLTSEGEILKTSAILAYSSFTLVKPWIRPVGLPWASWVWNISFGLWHCGEGGEVDNGGAEGTALLSSSPVELLESCVCGLMASPSCITPSSPFSPKSSCMLSSLNTHTQLYCAAQVWCWISDEGNQVTGTGDCYWLCEGETWHHFSQRSYYWYRRREQDNKLATTRQAPEENRVTIVILIWQKRRCLCLEGEKKEARTKVLDSGKKIAWWKNQLSWSMNNMILWKKVSIQFNLNQLKFICKALLKNGHNTVLV